MNALVDAHQMTADSRFLENAEEIVRRATHPADDIDSLELLDAERRWFYTVFLETLVKY